MTKYDQLIWPKLKLKKEHSGSESEISEGHGDGHEIYNQAYYDEVK